MIVENSKSRSPNGQGEPTWWYPRPVEQPGLLPPPTSTQLPPIPQLHWEPAFGTAYDGMTTAGLYIDLNRWTDLLKGFRSEVEADRDAAARGEVSWARRDSPEDLLKQLDRFDAEVRRRHAESPDGRIRCDWHQLSWPGRLTTRGLPLQSLPRPLRPAFVPEPGNSFVLADWSACQPHILAAFSGDPQLRALLQDPRRDFYVELGRMAWTDLPDDRQAGKTVALPLLYGAGAERLAQRATQAGRPIPPQEVEAWHQGVRWAFNREFSTLTSWRKQLEPLWRWGSPLGRQIVVPMERRLPWKVVPGFAQAVEADAMRLVLMKSDEIMAGTGARLVFTHHDSSLWECPKGTAQVVAERATELMTSAMNEVLQNALQVPVKVGVHGEWINPNKKADERDEDGEEEGEEEGVY